MKAKYIEQFLRVERWFSRLLDDALSRPKTQQITEEYFQDDLYSFFINCYHLKDWIEKDNSIACTKSDTESFLAKNEYLKLCADLCNSSKHLVLNTKGRSQKSPRVGVPEIYTSVAIDPKAVKADSSLLQTRFLFYVETDDHEYIDALELASECINAWANFLIFHMTERTIEVMKHFNNQSVNGILFSCDKPVTLPKQITPKNISSATKELGNIIQVQSGRENLFVIVRLKAAYAHGEDRQKTRGGVLHGKFRQMSVSELTYFVEQLPKDSFIWLILAMEEQSKTEKMAKSLNVYISNIERLAEIESVLHVQNGG